MVGSAVATMVWFSAPRNIASAKPPMMAMTSRRPSLRSVERSTPESGATLSMSPPLRGAGSPVLYFLCFGDAMTGTTTVNEFEPHLCAALATAQDAWTTRLERVSYAVSLLFGSMIGCPHRSMQRTLFDHQKGEQRNRQADRSGDENPVEGRRQVAVAGRDLFQCRDAGPVADATEHDGAEYRHHERAAERAEKIQRAGRGAELVRLDHVLHDDGRDRIHRADTEAEHEQQHNDSAERMPRRVGGERGKRRDGDDEAEDRHAHVMFYAHDHARRYQRAERSAAHVSDQRQAGQARRDAEHGLAIQRHIDGHADDGADREERGDRDRAGHAPMQDRQRNERFARGEKAQREQHPQRA